MGVARAVRYGSRNKESTQIMLSLSSGTTLSWGDAGSTARGGIVAIANRRSHLMVWDSEQQMFADNRSRLKFLAADMTSQKA